MDAEADTLFQRGWLPDIVPSSSSSIISKNNMEFNTQHHNMMEGASPTTRLLKLRSLRKVDDRDSYTKKNKCQLPSRF